MPLFLKRSGQRRGAVSDANVEVVDIVPTVAAELGASLPWIADGANAMDADRAPRPTKVMFFDRASKRIEAAGDLRRTLTESAARKFSWLGTGDPLDVPTPEGRYGELIGQAVDPLRAVEPSAVEVTVDALPLNGTVAAVTRPYPFPVMGRRGAWEAVVDPRWFVPGANTLEVLEVREHGSDGTFALAAAHGDMAATRWPNLVREEQIRALGGQASGFYGIEWAGSRPFRWTDGDARLRVPLDPRSRPTELAVDVLGTGGAKRLRIAAGDCPLFDDVIRDGWKSTFDLGGCAFPRTELEIALVSDTHRPASRDNRSLGVAVGRIELRAAVP